MKKDYYIYPAIFEYAKDRYNHNVSRPTWLYFVCKNRGRSIIYGKRCFRNIYSKCRRRW